MPIGKLTEVPNFLPPPSGLIFPERNQKVTIELSPTSVHFFKKEAKKNHTKYQRLIRQVLDRYAKHYL